MSAGANFFVLEKFFISTVIFKYFCYLAYHLGAHDCMIADGFPGE